jgi:hypothetical protein
MARDDGTGAPAAALSCSICAEHLHRTIEGEAEPLVARLVKEHLAGCASCAAEAKALEAERIEILEVMLRSPALSDHFSSRVVRKIGVLEKARRGRELIRRSLTGLAAAAVVALAVWIGMGPRSSPAPVPLALAPDFPVAVESSAPGEDPVAARLPGPFKLVRFTPPPSSSGCSAGDTLRTTPLPNPIDYAAVMFPLDELPPCQRDVNHDGRTDVRDAAHLFMLALASAPSDLFRPGSEDITDDCDGECFLPWKS